MTNRPSESLIIQTSQLVEQRTGLAVGTQFRANFEAILHDLAQGDLPRYVAELRASHETAPAWQSLMYALTISETYFFRDRMTFQLLRTLILPNLIAARRQKKQFDLNIWSAGCSTGEEAYSIAITLYELLADREQWKIQIKASDINQRALQIARQGTYREWAFRHTDTGFQARYFDATPGGWQIKPHIRQMASFGHANLLDESSTPQFDIVFCRNVLLYFSTPFTEALENLIFKALVPGGWLAMGQSEAIRGPRERWITHVFPGAMLYQKPEQTPTPRVIYAQHAPPPLAANNSVAHNGAYDSALDALHDERSEDAENLLRGILAENPRHTPARLLLAYLYAGRHEVARAHQHLNAALDDDLMMADAYYLRATLFLEDGKDIEAGEALRAALYCQRDHPLAALLLGNLYAKAGDGARARRIWDSARQTTALFPPNARISVLSDMTAAGFDVLVKSQLASLNW